MIIVFFLSFFLFFSLFSSAEFCRDGWIDFPEIFPETCEHPHDSDIFVREINPAISEALWDDKPILVDLFD